MKRFAIAAVLAVSSSAFASSYSVGPISIPSTNTNWNLFLNVPKYDPALLGGAPLGQVEFILSGGVSGSYGVENVSTTASTDVDGTVIGTITLTRPDLSTIVITTPATAVGPVTFPVADGVLDFGGTSGNTWTIAGSDSDNVITSAAADLALFTGPGSINLPISSNGGFSGSLSGGIPLTTQQIFAEATLTVVYTAIPEPTALGLLAPAGLLIARRRRA